MYKSRLAQERNRKMKTKYKTIYDDMKEKILTGEYKSGDQLPDEHTVCSMYGCSRMTVKKAYDLLVLEGLIYRRQGQGSFVLAHSERDGELEIKERELQGFSRSSHGKGSTRIIHFNLIFAPKHIAEKLGIKENDPVYDILRLRLIDGSPYVLEQTYMAPALIPGITEEVLNRSIYDYIENTLGLRIGAAQKVSRADISSEQDHQLLNLMDVEPVLEVEQTAYLDNGMPFEYSISRHRYDLFKFSVYSVRQ